MAKGKTKKTTAGGDERNTEGIPEKEEVLAPMKGGRDEPANEVVVSVPVHCEGCARKVRRSLLRTEGFEEVIVDSSTNTVVVTGQKAMEDPMMVVEMVERRTRKKVHLLSPSPAKLPPSAVKSKDTKKEEAATADMKNDVAELDMKMAVVLKIEMHCEACSEEMKKRILKIKGVEEAVPHMKSSQLLVKGVVEPATLVGFIHKCTGRKAAIIRAEPLDPPPAAPMMDDETPADANEKQQEPSDNLDQKNEGVEAETKQEDDGEGGGGGEEQNADEKTKTEKHKKGDGDGADEEKTQVHMPNDAIDEVREEKNQTKDHQFKLPVQAAVVEVAPESEKMDVNSMYGYYYHPAYAYAYPPYAYQQYQYPYAGHPAAMYRPYPHYPPQTVSDENPPDACTIM